jgi:hypothetical protein
MIGVALYRGVSPLSRLIRWQTCSVYSHAALIDLGTNQVWEAWARVGVQGPHGAGDYHTPGTQVDVFKIVPDLTPTEETRLRRYAEQQMGRGYDYLGVLRFISRRSTHDPRAKLFCSEYVDQAFYQAGRPLLFRVNSDRVAPGHLAWSPLLQYVRHFHTSKLPPASGSDATIRLRASDAPRCPTFGAADRTVPVQGQGEKTVLQWVSAVLQDIGGGSWSVKWGDWSCAR